MKGLARRAVLGTANVCGRVRWVPRQCVLSVAARGAGTDVGEDLLDEAPVGLLVELGVKDDEGPGALEAVARHLHLVHGVEVEDVEADRGPVGRLCGPEVQVVVLAARLEEEGVVARREVAQLVDRREVVLVLELGLCERRAVSAVSVMGPTREVSGGTDPSLRAGGGRGGRS